MTHSTIMGLRLALSASIAIWFLVIGALSCAFGCGDNIDESGDSHGLRDLATEWLTSRGAVHGSVYRCESGAACGGETEEWCWDGDESTLESHLGVAATGCWRIGPDERWWPWLVGCAYGCPLDGPGANAHCGAFCP